jgi:hypothetical protein
MFTANGRPFENPVSSAVNMKFERLTLVSHPPVSVMVLHALVSTGPI